MISFDKYDKRLFSVTVEYDLARKAIQDLHEKPAERDSFAIDRYNEIKDAIIEQCKLFNKDPNQTWITNDDKVQDWINSYKESTLPQSLEDILNRLNQNEVIMKVTLFEVILKDIQREVLTQKPRLLSADRTVLLGKLIHDGQDKLVTDEIERAINILDRKNISEKAAYFKKQLNVDWTFDGHVLPIVKYVLDLRNRILHEDPDATVTNDDCFHTMVVAMIIPLVAIAQCAVLYPNGFEAPEKSNSLMAYFKDKLKDKT